MSFSEMATGNDSALVSTVMFDCIINKVYGDLLLTGRWESGSIVYAIVKNIAFFELFSFKAF